MIELNFKEFLKHVNINDFDHYQRGHDPEFHIDPLVVCGPLSAEVEPLYNIVLNNVVDGNIIEIGSWLGLSTITFALALKEKECFAKKQLNNVVYAIDPHDTEHSIVSDGLLEWFKHCPFDMSEKFLENIHKWEVNKYVEYHRCFSQRFDLSNIENKDIGLLFIDGDHRHEEVKKDLIKFVPILAKDGLLIMHDRQVVFKAFEEFCQENQNVLTPVSDQEIDHLGLMIIARKV